MLVSKKRLGHHPRARAGPSAVEIQISLGNGEGVSDYGPIIFVRGSVDRGKPFHDLRRRSHLLKEPGYDRRQQCHQTKAAAGRGEQLAA